MKRILIAVALFTLTHASFAQSDTKNGQTKYQKHCQVCHGVTAKGDGPLASTLPHKPANIPNELNSFFTTKNSLVTDVLNGKVEQGMPAWKGTLSKQDVLDIFAYIESVQ